MHESTTYPFPSRPGVVTGNDSFDFETEPASALSPEQLSEVIEFEHQLYGVSLDADKFTQADLYKSERISLGEPLQPFESIWLKKSNQFAFGVNYFTTPIGKQALTEVSGIQLPENCTKEELIITLSRWDIHSIKPGELDKLEADSIGYEEKQITEQFIDNGFKADGINEFELVHIIKNPEAIVEKAQGYIGLKKYITRAIDDLRQAESSDINILNAKLLIARLYIERLNTYIADTYVTAHILLSQYKKSEGKTASREVNQLVDVLPAFFVDSDDDSVANFLQRLDRYSDGVIRDENGHLTWLSSEAKQLADSAAHPKVNEGEPVDRGIYGDIDVAKLKKSYINGQVFGDWLREVLETYGILSEHSEWTSTREGAAPDSKWQVIVDDKFKSLAVNDKQRIVKVPAKATSLFSAITIGNHEVTHVIQCENKRVIGDLAITKKIGIDSPSEQTESGGKWQEAVARGKLIGHEDISIAGTSYLKALLVKAEGGSYGQCVEAYYEDLVFRNPNGVPEHLAAQAVNRARRLFRSGGTEYAQRTKYLTNTQPLNYLEQQLIYQSLDERSRKLLFVGGIAISNFIRMAKLGLVDFNKIQIPEKMPWELFHNHVVEVLAQSFEHDN